MNLKKRFYILGVKLVFLSVILIQFSCEKEDNEKPVVSFFQLNHSNEDTLHVNLNDTIIVSLRGTDNEEIKSYRISLYNNFDFNLKSNTAFSNYLIGDFCSDSVQLQAIVNDSVLAGPYFAKAEIVDQEGNVSETVSRNWFLNRIDAPTLSISSPDLNSSVNFSNTDTILVEGNLSDDIDVNTLEIRVVLISDQSIVKRQFYAYSENDNISIDMTNSSPLKFGLNGIESGDYLLFYILKDNHGNIDFKQQSITIN